MNRILILAVLALFATAVFAQKNYPSIKIAAEPEHIARLKAINRDIWGPFAEAYAAGDADAYIALHTPDFIRASITEVQDLEAYRSSSKRHFNYNKTKNSRCEIAFTFFERVAGTDRASERGIYRYTAIQQDGGRLHYYGKFHVFHRKIGDKWKIAVDYDSDEDGSISQGDFEAGLPPDVFEKKPQTGLCMKNAIALDDSLGRARNYACERISLSETIREYVAGMEKIDFGACPTDFSEGFRQHIAAWSALLPLTDKHADLRGEMHVLFKQLESGPEGEAFKAGVKKVWDTWALVEAAIKANGG